MKETIDRLLSGKKTYLSILAGIGAFLIARFVYDMPMDEAVSIGVGVIVAGGTGGLRSALKKMDKSNSTKMLLLLAPALFLVGCAQVVERARALDWDAYVNRATCSAVQMAGLRHEFASLEDQERWDQIAHFEAGSLAARGWMKFNMTEDEAVARVVEDAELRECLQSPEEKRGGCTEESKPQWCGTGCERDLHFWELGARAGAICAAAAAGAGIEDTPADLEE